MKNLVWCAALFLVACDDSSSRSSRPTVALPPPAYEEAGPELQEKGHVLDTAFRMGSSTSTTTQTPRYNKTIEKSAWDDPLGMHSKTVVVPSTNSTTNVTIQDQFAVVFECQHGKFVIESLGKESIAHKLWMKLKQGSAVNIRYKEVFRVVPATNERKLVKYDFIDAEMAKD